MHNSSDETFIEIEDKEGNELDAVSCRVHGASCTVVRILDSWGESITSIHLELAGLHEVVTALAKRESNIWNSKEC